jgi:hypothetical protein
MPDYKFFTSFIIFFGLNNKHELLLTVIEGKRPSLEGLKEELKELVEVIVSCWNEEREKRIKLNELIDKMRKIGGEGFELMKGSLLSKGKQENQKKEQTLSK